MLNMKRILVLFGALALTIPASADKQADIALLNAAINGQATQVKALLAQGAKPNVKGNAGYTPLLRAAEAGHTEIARSLLDAGANVNTKQKEGWTALLLACREGHAGVAGMLLSEKAKFDVKHKGRTPIHYAAESGCDGCLRDLAARDKKIVNDKDAHGDTPIILAARGGHAGAVKFLLTNKAKVNEKSKENWTPLLAAIQGGHTECVRALLAAGASPKGKRKGVSALKMAEIGGNSEIVAMLQGAGAKK
jgi:uncharacterized protein